MSWRGPTMSLSGESKVSAVLQAVQAGDRQAAAELLPLVYDELRKLAAHKLAHQTPGQTLQPTALVHEACLRIAGDSEVTWDGRQHFFLAAARAMRDILVEQARRKAGPKQGGDRGRQDQAVLRGHSGAITALAFSQDGRRLVSASYDLSGSQGDATARFWQAAPEATLPVLAGHTNYVYPTAYSPDGHWIASAGWDNYIRLWDAATGEECAKLPHPGVVWTLAFTPDGTRLVSGGEIGGEMLVWDVATGHIRRRIESGKSVRSLAISPDGATLAAGNHDPRTGWTMSIVDVASGQEIGTGEGIPFTFSADGKWLACRDGGGKHVVLWDGRTFRPVIHLQGHTDEINAIAFDRNGRRFVSASSDRTVRLWDPGTGECLRVFEGHTDVVYAAAFHPDGKRIASAGRDRAVWLWDPASDQEVARLPGHRSYVWSLAFSPDGETLISGSGDFTVRLWDTSPLAERYQARREAETLRPEADRLVAKLLREKKDLSAVAVAIRSDRSLSESQRHAAFRAVLREGMKGDR